MDLDTELPIAYEYALVGNFDAATRIMFAAIHEYGASAVKHPMYAKTGLVPAYIAWLQSSDSSPLLKALQSEREATLHRKAT